MLKASAIGRLDLYTPYLLLMPQVYDLVVEVILTEAL